MAKKYQVFISSTYNDLKEERKNIIDTLLSADCIPAGMEAFVATDSEQFDVIKKVIDLCDYYILIIGKRYGSINISTGVSYTEMEYEYAKSKGIPVLVFAMDEASIKADDSSDNLDKLMAFRTKAMTNRLGSIWKDTTDLVRSVALSIMKAKNEIPRSGWIPATDYDETSLLKQIVRLNSELDELKKINEELKGKVEIASQIPDLAFEDGIIHIKCRKMKESSGYYDNAVVNTNFKAVFLYISRDLLDVSATEEIIKNSINDFIHTIKAGYYLYETQVVRTILIQLKGLGLVYSKWNKENSKLYWALTTKGARMRDELTYVKKIIK